MIQRPVLSWMSWFQFWRQQSSPNLKSIKSIKNCNTLVLHGSTIALWLESLKMFDTGTTWWRYHKMQQWGCFNIMGLRTVVDIVPTYDKNIGHDTRNGDASHKFENDINIDVGWESSTNSKHQEEEVWQQDHKASAKPVREWRQPLYTMYKILVISYFWVSV